MAVPVELEIFMRDLTKAGLKSAGKNIQDVETQTKLLITALEQVRASQLHQLEVNKAAGLSYTQEAANIQALTGQIKGLKAGLNDLEKAKTAAAAAPSPKVDIDTDAVTRKTNNLKMQFSQVARELPSLAMGPQIFFLAISNNLPMLTDAIADARKQNDLLRASGLKGVPVWKQLASAMFSWQTALVAGITLLVVFGKDITNWIKNLGKAKKELDATTEAQNKWNEIHKKGGKAAQEETAKLNILYKASQDTTRSLNDRKKAVDELQKLFPNYFGKLTNEAILAGKAATAYDNLTKAIIKKGQAQAAEEVVADYTKKNFDLQRSINADTNWTNRNKTAYEAALKERDKMWENYRNVNSGSIIVDNVAKFWVGNTSEGKLIEEYEKRTAKIKKNTENIAKNNQIINDIVKQIDTSAYVEDFTPKNKDKTDYVTELANARVKAEQTVEKLRIQLMMEGREKRRAIAQQEYEETIDDIDRIEKETIKKLDKSKKKGDIVTDADYKAVRDNATTQRALQQLALNKELEAIDREYYDKAAEAMIAYNKEYGTYQEKRAAIAAEYAKKILKAETEGERLSLQKQYKKDINDLNFEEMKSGIDFAKVFGNIDIQSTESLKALQDKLYEYINGAAKNLSPENLKELQDAFKEIDAELLERNPFESLKERTREMMDAAKELQKAKEELERVQAGEQVVSGYRSITNERGEVVKIEETYLSASQALEKYNKARDKSEEKSRDMVKAEKQAMSQVNELASSVKSIGSTIGGQAGEVITLIGNVTSFTTTAIDGISSVMLTGANALSAMEKASVILGIISTAAQIFQSIGDMFGGDSGPSDYDLMLEKYQALSSLWDELIAKKMEYISIDYGDEAAKAAEEARKLIETQIALARQALIEAANDRGSYTNLLTGKRGLNAKITAYNENNNIGIGSLEELLNASPEKMAELLQDTEFVKMIAEANSELLQYMQTIAEYGQQLDELSDKEKEAITGVSFSDFRNSYTDLLKDLDSTNEDFAENLENYLRDAMLSSLIANQYDQEMKNLYDKWVELGTDGLTKDEVELLKQQAQELTNKLLEERENLKEIFGWESSMTGTNQTPVSGALTTMSQDSIATFEGIGRSVQTHLISIDKVSTEIRDQQREDSKALIKIVENTSHLLPIRELLEKIERDGLTVK